MKDKDAFSKLLIQAIHRIRAETQIPLGRVQDEVGYAIGREKAGGTIQYWCKGHVPAKHAEVEKLAAELYRRGGLRDRDEVQRFLRYADHPDIAGCCGRILTESSLNELPPTTASLARITVMIEGYIESFQSAQREQLIADIAHQVGIAPSQITIARIVPGSIWVTMELPTSAARQLRNDYLAGDPALRALGIMRIEWDTTAADMATAAVMRLCEIIYLEAVNMRINDAATQLRDVVMEAVTHLADPLLPATEPLDLDTATGQAAAQASLEAHLERHPALQEQVAALLDATKPLLWSNVQRIAVLVWHVARAVVIQMGQEPAVLTSTLHDYIRHLSDPWQAALPRRWWRWPWQGWLQANGDAIWHIRIAHAATLALLRMDEQTWQDTVARSAALAETLHHVLPQGHVPLRDQSAFLNALQNGLPQMTDLVHATRQQGQTRQPTPVSSPAAAEPFRTTWQQGGVNLKVSTSAQRGFILTVPIPQTPPLAVLSGHNSLFNDSLPEVPHAPTVSVTLREDDGGKLTLLVGISEVFQAVRWQIDVLVGEQVLASATTDEVGIAEFSDLPRELVQQGDISLHCRELLRPEQEHQQEEE